MLHGQHVSRVITWNSIYTIVFWYSYSYCYHYWCYHYDHASHYSKYSQYWNDDQLVFLYIHRWSDFPKHVFSTRWPGSAGTGPAKPGTLLPSPDDQYINPNQKAMTIPQWLIWLSKNNPINLTMAQKRSHKFDILLSKSEVLNSPRKKPTIIQDCIQPHEGRSFSDIRLKDTSRRMPALLITMSTRPYLMTISCWVKAWRFLDCRKPWVLPAKYRGVL